MAVVFSSYSGDARAVASAFGPFQEKKTTVTEREGGRGWVGLGKD